MPKSHPPYAPEFRRQMVELVRSGRTPQELSREFEPTAQAIWNWVRQTERGAGRRDDGLPEAERAELARLRRENRQLRQEREILAKARRHDTCRPRRASRPGAYHLGDGSLRHLQALARQADASH